MAETDRRGALAAGAALAGAALSGAALSGGAVAAAPPASRPPIVLVHGTWLGGWVWAPVAERLRAAGHRVFTPTLTGCGERHHLGGPEVGLATHIADIAHVILFEELHDVVLVAHSFSGVAMTGAADRLRERIGHLVYFDALIPAPGRMSALERGPEGSPPGWWAERRARFVDGWGMDYWADYPAEMLVPPDRPDLEARLRRLMRPHPARAWEEELRLEHGGWQGLPRAAFRAAAQRFRPSSERMWGPATGPGWSLVDLPVQRLAMQTEPAVLADALLALAAEAQSSPSRPRRASTSARS